MTKENQAILATTGRLKHFRSRNQPQKILAQVAAIPLVNAPRVRDRTEKYFVR